MCPPMTLVIKGGIHETHSVASAPGDLGDRQPMTTNKQKDVQDAKDVFTFLSLSQSLVRTDHHDTAHLYSIQVSTICIIPMLF